MADLADRSLGIGYTGGSTLLFVCLMTVLGIWYWSERTISVNAVSTPKVEAFYWAAITFSQTLGTALGDWLADSGGLGYEGGAMVFGAGPHSRAMRFGSMSSGTRPARPRTRRLTYESQPMDPVH